MRAAIFEQIVALVEEKMGKYNKQILPETCLEKDLTIFGDDAVDLLLDYGRRFNVDLSDFQLGKYFSPEGDSILPDLIRFLFRKKNRKDSELTMGDLAKGVIAGRLDEDVINELVK